MLVADRLTRNERDVLATALIRYRNEQIDRLDHAGHALDIADAEWRKFQCDALLLELAGR